MSRVFFAAYLLSPVGVFTVWCWWTSPEYRAQRAHRRQDRRDLRRIRNRLHDENNDI